MKPLYVVVFGAERIGVSSICSRVNQALLNRKVASTLVQPDQLGKLSHASSIKTIKPQVVIVDSHPLLKTKPGKTWVNTSLALEAAVGVRLQGIAKHLCELPVGTYRGADKFRSQEDWFKAQARVDQLTADDLGISTIKNVHVDPANHGHYARLYATSKLLDLVLWELSKTPQPAGRTNYGDAA